MFIKRGDDQKINLIDPDEVSEDQKHKADELKKKIAEEKESGEAEEEMANK